MGSAPATMVLDNEPERVARISVAMDRRFRFPMHLSLKGKLDGDWFPVPFDEEAGYDRLLEGLVQNPRSATFDLDIEPQPLTAIRLRITETDPFQMPWTMSEIRVYGPEASAPQ